MPCTCGSGRVDTDSHAVMALFAGSRVSWPGSVFHVAPKVVCKSIASALSCMREIFHNQSTYHLVTSCVALLRAYGRARVLAHTLLKRCHYGHDLHKATAHSRRDGRLFAAHILLLHDLTKITVPPAAGRQHFACAHTLTIFYCTILSLRSPCPEGPGSAYPKLGSTPFEVCVWLC